MAIDHVLSVLPVRDVTAAHDWYTQLFGRPADNHPMESLVEWRVTDTGWLQVSLDEERAGRGLLNFAVDDLSAHVDGVRSRGLEPGEIQGVNKGVQLSALTDPDGNTITFIGNFRVSY